MPRQLHPTGVALSYLGQIMRVVKAARALFQAKAGRLRSIVNHHADALAAHHDAQPPDHRTDAWDDDEGDEVNEIFDDLSRQLFAEFTNADLSETAARIGRATADFQKEQWNRQMRSLLGVDVVNAEPWLVPRIEAFARANVALVKSVPESYFTEIEKIVTQGMSEGVRWEELADDMTERYGVAESRATLIARDQVGKLTGQVNEERQTELGVSRFVWRTSNDNRVRASHADLEGETFSWDDPPEVDGEEDVTPGKPINCRCQAEPVLDDVIEQLTGEGATPDEDASGDEGAD